MGSVVAIVFVSSAAMRGGCRHCLSFHSTTLQLLDTCNASLRSDTPTMAAISGTASAPRAFCGDASSRNEKSGNLASCLLAGGVLFRPLAIRYDVFPSHRGCDTPGVRKHRAPKGALRLSRGTLQSCMLLCQKAPSAKRCIKTHFIGDVICTGEWSESTKRQKVH